MARRKKISVVIPLYNEEQNVRPIVQEITRHIPSRYEYEIILVDDGSTDNTIREIESLSKNKRIKGIVFYKNYGHQSALLAGIHRASGDAVITMDADFQHPPQQIPELIRQWEEKHDLVLAKHSFGDSAGFSLKTQPFRLLGYGIYKLIAGEVLVAGVSDFRLMDRSLVSHINQYREIRFVLRGLTMQQAKNPIIIPYRLNKRKFGSSKYSFSKLSTLFLNSVTSFSLRPLRLSFLISITLIVLTLFYLVYILYQKFVVGQQIIQGWTALVFLVSILFSFLFLYLGLIGEYIGSISEEVKQRPRYFVERTLNLGNSRRK